MHSKNKFKSVTDKLNYFVVRRNKIFERSKFNMKKQEEGESVDTFITALQHGQPYIPFRTSVK